jgi:hypothetical protein
MQVQEKSSYQCVSIPRPSLSFQIACKAVIIRHTRMLVSAVLVEERIDV